METHSFQLELPEETSDAAAHNAGLNHIVKTPKLKTYAAYRFEGSSPHPKMSGMWIFNDSYKA